MPYDIRPNHPDCATDEVAVVKSDDDTLMGCHGSREAAEAQIAALYANEDD